MKTRLARRNFLRAVPVTMAATACPAAFSADQKLVIHKFPSNEPGIIRQASDKGDPIVQFVSEQILRQIHDLDSPSKVLVGSELFNRLRCSLGDYHIHWDYQNHCQVLTIHSIELERFDSDLGFWIDEPWFLCIEQKKDCGPFGMKNVPVVIVKDVRHPTKEDIIA